MWNKCCKKLKNLKNLLAYPLRKKAEKYFCFGVLLIQAFYSAAQTYQAQAPLPKVQRDGFYAIPVTPAMGSLLQPGFPDIRILDADAKEVPYLQQSEERVMYRTEFRNLAFSKEVLPGLSRMDIENANREALNHFKLQLANTAAQKMLRISGSDDGQTWYLVLDRYLLSIVPDADKTEVEQLVSFPLTMYSHYRIELNDSGSAPVNIKNISVSRSTSASGRYAHISAPRITQTDSSDKCSYINLYWNAAHTIDQLQLQMQTPAFYHRNYTVLVRDSSEVKHHWYYSYHEIGSGTLDSRSAPLILLPSVKLASCVLRIENGDSPPLQVQQVQPSQLTRYLVSWLEKGESYRVVMGAYAHAPDYDLDFFRDKIPAQLPLLEAGTLTMQTQEAKSPAKEGENKLVWGGLSLLVLVIFLVSSKILRDMRNRKDQPGG